MLATTASSRFNHVHKSFNNLQNWAQLHFGRFLSYLWMTCPGSIATRLQLLLTQTIHLCRWVHFEVISLHWALYCHRNWSKLKTGLKKTKRIRTLIPIRPRHYWSSRSVYAASPPRQNRLTDPAKHNRYRVSHKLQAARRDTLIRTWRIKHIRLFSETNCCLNNLACFVI